MWAKSTQPIPVAKVRPFPADVWKIDSNWIISSAFSRAIAAQKSITLAEAREFLKEHKNIRRTPKQVQDKVASIGQAHT